MVKRSDALSVYIPKDKADQRLLERLSRLGKQRDRSVNHLIVQAILQYLDRCEEEGCRE